MGNISKIDGLPDLSTFLKHKKESEQRSKEERKRSNPRFFDVMDRVMISGNTETPEKTPEEKDEAGTPPKNDRKRNLGRNIDLII
ncbi:MAG: hypothetical protein AAFW89_05865 [Bacteroidota bacterium]